MSVRVVRSDVPARAVSAAAVLLLHAGILLGLLWMDFGQRPLTQLHERTIWLHLGAETHALTVKPSRAKVLRYRSRLPRQWITSRPAPFPSVPIFEVPTGPDQKNLSGLHGQLFDCAPESLASLDEEQRFQCQKGAGVLRGYDPNAVDFADRSGKVPGAARWARNVARNVARKNSPFLLPCASPLGINFLGTAACIATGVAKGFDFDIEHKPEYFDKVEEAHVPNNGDPPPPPH